MITNQYDKYLLYKYYATYVKENTNYLPLNEDSFNHKVLENKTVLVSKNNEINGFISCCIQDTDAYITLHFGDRDTKIRLLQWMEDVLATSHIFKIWIHFFNPVRIPFYPIQDIIHPGVQGVEYHSKEYTMYKNLGYCDNSLQNTFYLQLKKFHSTYIEYPSMSISIEIYNSTKHKGLHDFASRLNAPHWEREIILNDNSKNPLPLLVALDNNVVIGFTGPLAVSDSGRGYFAGIGILSEYQGRKIGKYLFHNLCFNLKTMGATYMTLFTGENNRAKYIYLKAGFQIVSRQMTMKKIIGSDSREI
jgi:ribosomal protein S18 acetylase RimI-like enzyme